jgi:hemerythrin-like metal-binding protein
MDQARAIETLTYSGAISQALAREHQTITNAIELISEAVLSGAPPTTVECLLDMLVTFCEGHFTSEERYLNDRGYRESRSHATAHEDLLRLCRAAQSLGREGLLGYTGEISFLLRSLRSHIDNFDKPAHASIDLASSATA